MHIVSMRGLGIQRTRNAVLVLIFGAVLAKTLGFGRELVTSYLFGATRAVDIYLVAGILPWIFSTIVASSLNTVVIPVFIQLKQQEGDNRAWKDLISPLLISVGLLLVVFSILAYLAAPLFVNLFAAGFDEKARAEAVAMTRVMSPALLLAGLSGLLTGILQAYKHFTITALSAPIMNVGLIAALVWLTPQIGNKALSVSYVVGAFLMFALLLGALVYKRVPFQFSTKLWSTSIQKLVKVWIPLLVGSAVVQLDYLINRVVASQLPEGSIAGLNYANLIYNILPSVVLTSIGSAIFPQLSTQWAEQDKVSISHGFKRALAFSWSVAIPGVVFLMLFASPIVQIVYQRGAFDAHATWVTSGALLFYAPALIAETFLVLAYRVFYASQNTLTPLWISFLAIGTSIAFNLILVRFMDHRGLALATVLSTLVGSLLCAFYLKKKGLVLFGGIAKYLFWFMLTSALAGGVVLGFDLVLSSLWPLTLRLMANTSLFGLIYLVLNLYKTSPLSSTLLGWLGAATKILKMR